jgi:hypothetical protein
MKMTLEEQIIELHSELEAVIAKYVDERAAMVPGVPRGSVETTYLARAHGCRCREFRIIQKLVTDAEELRIKQQKDEHGTASV